MDVLVLIGSKSDLAIGEGITGLLDKFGAKGALHVASAHRSPDKVKRHIKEAEESGAKVVIACAGMSAHLAGVVASETMLPVIGVPVDAGPMAGVDALYSTVNMPGGVPVATVSIGKAGAKNAALLALRIMALGDKDIAAKLNDYKAQIAEEVEQADREVAGG